MWRLAGCPMHGELWEKKKAAKRAYRNALDNSRKNSKRQKMVTLSHSMYSGNSKKFWSVWRGQSCSNAKSYVHNAENFVNQFRGNFKTDDDRNSKMKEFLNTLLNSDCPSVTVEDVESAVKSLKSSTSLDCERLCINHIIYSHPAVYSCISELFKL